jgi:hypothetical protein
MSLSFFENQDIAKSPKGYLHMLEPQVVEGEKDLLERSR